MKYQIINGAITFGNNTILEEINFTINKSDRIAIVGRNGSGKTSLLKSLVDNDMLESGIGFDDLRIVKIGKPSIGYQEQHAFSNLDVTLLDEILKVYKNITNLENKIKKLEDKMISNATSETILEYTDCIERYKLMGGYSYKKEYEVALRSEIQTGEAEIICELENGKKEQYRIEISKIYTSNNYDNKSMMIKITDERLLQKTGGIIQGMSGSPIIQNGKFVGAITNVLVSDPTTGYAIFGDLMVKQMKSVK